MRTFTFIKRFASVLLAVALMLPTFAQAQNTVPTDFLTKSKKSKQELTRTQGQKMSPKMKQMIRDVKTSQSIPSATNLTKTLPNKNVSRAPLAVTSSGATLFGNLIYNDNWADMTQAGYYSIDPNTGEYLPVGTNEQLAGAGTVVDGIAYVSYADSFWGMIFGLYTIVYDVEAATIIEIVEHNPEDFGSYAVNYAYNYVEDVIYALTYTEDGSQYTLSTFDRDSYTYNRITELYLPSDIFAMTFDPNGVLYIICADGIVREMDPSTGAIVNEVCNTGFLPEYMQSACWSPTDNKILWAASNDTESYILAIDVTSGTTETLCTFYFYEEWTSLYTTDPMASQDAPAAPVISQAFNAPGSLLGSIEVESPTLNIGGGNLSTNYNLVIELNDIEIYNNTVTPGNNVSLTDVEFAEGINKIRAYATNDAGKGAVASKKVYAGDDTPLAVTNLEVSVDENGQVTLSWTAPTEGENGGYLNLSTLTYTIERSGETIAEGITNTSYVDQLPDEMASYQWVVYAVSGDKVSKPTYSESILYGDAVTLPYEQVFNDEKCLDIYTIVNNNEDDRTWQYDATREALLYPYSSSNDADDYAFTPPLKFNNGSMILVEVNTCSYSLSYPETLEVTFGSSTNLAEQTVVIPATQLDWEEPQTLRAYLSVEESGDYYVGIHAISAADSYYLLVKDIKVSEGPGFEVPAAVTNVTATPGVNGALTTTLTFTAPELSLGGNTLTEDVTVTAYRNEEVVGTTTIAPGATGTITDNNAQNGNNKYVLATSNSNGEGDIYEISCFCGVDLPTYITDITFTTADNNLSTVMSWEAPTVGVNGGYVNPEELIYTVYVPTADGLDIEILAETSEPEYEFSVDDKTLQGYTLYVSAKNEAGESDLYGGSVVLGAPYPLPFVENIEGAVLEHSPWYLYNEDPSSYTTWELGGIMENYNLPEAVVAPDGGMAVCYDFWEFTGGVCGLMVPKITLVGETAPTLYFSMYHYTTADDANELTISITTDDATYDDIFAKKVNDTDANGWSKYVVSLEDFKDATWIGIMLKANITPNGFVFVDYVTVENASENDVMVESLTTPKNVTIGEEAEIIASVLNKGTNAASFNVSFYIGDEEIANVTDAELESNGKEEFKASFIPTADDLGEAAVKVVVTMNDATDEVMNNNEATANIAIVQPHLRVVTDLTATAENGIVTLNWSEPTLAPEPVVDDMEEYESFIVENIGNYTIVDADMTETYGIEGADNLPLPNGPKAWQVWAPTELGISTESWQAHDGNKCLIAFSTVTGAADDWLISPEIVGGTEVSFWAAIPTNQYGAETFEVLYSTSSTDINSFQLLSQETKNTTDWEEFSYTLPNDAKYFAIRYTSIDIFALLIDDMSYSDPSGSTDISILGYNVYCDGKKVNDTDVSETTYSYTPVGTISPAFNVTVIYNEGESLFSNTVVIDEVGIKDLNSLGVNIYGQDNYIRIENVEGRMVSVYSIDGKVVCNMKSTDSNILIPANLGVYIVNIDNIATCKVLVK